MGSMRVSFVPVTEPAERRKNLARMRERSVREPTILEREGVNHRQRQQTTLFTDAAATGLCSLSY